MDFTANVAVNVFSAMISLVLLVYMLLVNKKQKDMLHKLFTFLVLCNLGMAFCDALAYIFDGNTLLYGFYIKKAVEFGVYIFGALGVSIYSAYLQVYLKSRRGGESIRWSPLILIKIFSAITIFMALISPFWDFYYYIDTANVYHRGEGYFISQMWVYIIMALNVINIWLNRRYVPGKEIVFLLSYMAIPLLFNIIHMLFYGYSIINMATTIAVLVVYVGIQAEQAKKIKEQELEIAEGQIAVMLSQIQPHFLYNSLASINELSDGNPEAQQAIIMFSNYLRTNMDSISKKDLIPFVQELNHVKQYLWLEKMRFEDKLKIEYDIEYEDFKLPALTIQPIAENSVLHGITNKEDGGTIRIRTYRSDGYAFVSVEDTGIGFDTGNEYNEGRSHIGIDNVRGRLKAMCNGTLTLESTPDSGTVAVIKIPLNI